jgi:hypothetical protein
MFLASSSLSFTANKKNDTTHALKEGSDGDKLRLPSCPCRDPLIAGSLIAGALRALP